MSKKILVVDDEKLIVKGITFSLEQEGFEIDSAFDGIKVSLFWTINRGRPSERKVET